MFPLFFSRISSFQYFQFTLFLSSFTQLFSYLLLRCLHFLPIPSSDLMGNGSINWACSEQRVLGQLLYV